MKKSRLDYTSPTAEVFVVHFEGNLCQSGQKGTIQTGMGKRGYDYYTLDEEE